MNSIRSGPRSADGSHKPFDFITAVLSTAARVDAGVLSDVHDLTHNTVGTRPRVRSHSIRFHRQGKLIGLKIYRKRIARLRELAYSAVVIDQFLLENEPAESDQVLEHLGAAFPLYPNFAMSGMERLVGAVRSAPHRRKREETQARRAVEQPFRAKCVKASHPCCSPANWPCPSPECPDLRRKKYEPSTIWPAKWA